MPLAYVANENLSMQSHPQCNERWVQSVIADNPSILGLGSLALRGSEKKQMRGGRLDLLLEDAASGIRYEVELQLGATDPSHIIRSIEYWDFERRRYPQYNHIAVIVAEEITSRFFNVISLFNHAIPIIAIKVTALKVGELMTLNFTKVLDIPSLRVDDPERDPAPVNRQWWEDASTPAIMAAADSLLLAARSFQPTTDFVYAKSYVGTSVDGQLSNYFSFAPQKRALWMYLHIQQSTEVDQIVDASGLERSSYDTRSKLYRLRLTPEDIRERIGPLHMLLTRAYKETEGDPPLIQPTTAIGERLAGATN